MSRPQTAFALSVSMLTAVLLSACTGALKNGGGYDYSVKAKENSFDRAAFGKSPLPVWSALTAPEIRALANREKAAAGDPRALLDLAIFASGAPRSEAGYDSIHRQVEAFVARIRPQMEAEAGVYRKGLNLNQAMHAGFFLQAAPPSGAARAGAHSDGGAASNGGAGSEGSGYDFDQSALVPIFATRKFNCISSAVLYVVLARHFNLKASGVILPSHAFAQIETPEGKVIEVETTMPAGFDWIHDEAFYRKKAIDWFRSRRLPPSSFRDYSERKIVAPHALIAYNMENQHTAPGRMAQVDRCRLEEARGYIDGGARDAQLGRLNFYNAEYLYLKERKDFAALERMFSTVTPAFPEIRRGWKDDAGMSNRLAWAYHEHAYVLNELGRGLEGLPLVDSSLACLRKEEEHGPPVYGNNVGLVQTMAGKLGEEKKFSEAEAVLKRFPGLATEEPAFRKTFAWLYNKWAVDLWNKEDWEGTLARFEQQKEVSILSERKAVMDNMTNAYLNWAAGFQNEGDWPKTRQVLARCMDRLPEARKCRSLLEQIVAQHNLE